MASTTRALGQAMAMVLAPLPPQGFAQAQADIVRHGVYGFGQTQVSVVRFAKQNVFAQAQADIMNSGQAYGQAQCFITI